MINQGTIDGGSGSGVDLLAGGTVSNSTGAWIGGVYGVAIQGIAGTVVNAGTIDASAGSAGIFLTHGGSVTNQAGGKILGGYGISTKGNAATVLNAGAIVADTADAAIELSAGGSVTNAAGASLSGNWGIAIQGSASGSVSNAGVITGGAQSGVFLTGGTVVNQSGGMIGGNWAVAIVDAAGTVINGGSMVGTGGTAVTLPAGYANLMEVQPGATFTGAVEGGNTIGAGVASTLELAAGATVGTLAGIGASITEFFLDRVPIPAPVGIVSGVLAGFAKGIGFRVSLQLRHDPPDRCGGEYSGTYAAERTGSWSSMLARRSARSRRDGQPGYGEKIFCGSRTPASRLPVSPPAPGIATPGGAAAVETLAPGQRVILANGGSAPVVWLGRRRIACDRHPNPHAVWPIRIAAGAFGDGLQPKNGRCCSRPTMPCSSTVS